MRWHRMLMVLGLALALVTLGSGCRDVLTAPGREIPEPPLGLSSVPGNDSVTLRRQAGDPGRDRRTFDSHPADGLPGSTPGETISAAFGTSTAATLATDPGAGAFTPRREAATLPATDDAVSTWREHG